MTANNNPRNREGAGAKPPVSGKKPKIVRIVLAAVLIVCVAAGAAVAAHFKKAAVSAQSEPQVTDVATTETTVRQTAAQTPDPAIAEPELSTVQKPPALDDVVPCVPCFDDLTGRLRLALSQGSVNGKRIWYNGDGLYRLDESTAESSLLYASSSIRSAAFDGETVVFSSQDEPSGGDGCTVYRMRIQNGKPSPILKLNGDPEIIFFDEKRLVLTAFYADTGETKLCIADVTQPQPTATAIATLGLAHHATPLVANGCIVYAAGAYTYDSTATLFCHDLRTGETRALAEDVMIYGKSLAFYADRLYYKTYEGIGSIRLDGTENRFYTIPVADKNSISEWGAEQVLYFNYGSDGDAQPQQMWYLYSMRSGTSTALQDADRVFGNVYDVRGTLYSLSQQEGTVTLCTHADSGELQAFRRIAAAQIDTILDVTDSGVWYVSAADAAPQFAAFQ